MKEFWNNKNVLVTGASGFLGYWLTRALVQHNAQVITFVRDHDPQSALIRSGLINKTRVVQGALEDYSSVERSINVHDVTENRFASNLHHRFWYIACHFSKTSAKTTCQNHRFHHRCLCLDF